MRLLSSTDAALITVNSLRALCLVWAGNCPAWSTCSSPGCACPAQEQQQKDNTMLKRLGRPEDMAAAVAYLASGDAAYVTGETLVVSGGMPSRL